MELRKAFAYRIRGVHSSKDTYVANDNIDIYITNVVLKRDKCKICNIIESCEGIRVNEDIYIFSVCAINELMLSCNNGAVRDD